MRTILLTGATGKIGLVLSRYFLDQGDIVIAVSSKSSSLEKTRKLLGANSGFYGLVVNLVDYQSMQVIEGYQGHGTPGQIPFQDD